MFAMPKTGPKRGEALPQPCAGLDLNLFFPATESVDLTRPNAAERTALAVCAGCPLAARRLCLEQALTYPISDQFGVVGGATGAQRKALIRGRKAALLVGVAA